MTVRVGSVTYPEPGLRTSTVRIAPLLGSTVLTMAVACVPPAGGADIDITAEVVYAVPPLTTSIPLLALPPK